MKKILKEGQTFKSETLGVEAAKRYWHERNQPFKVELIEDLEKEGVTEISHEVNMNKKGEETFTDLCRGGHVAGLKDIPRDAFKVMNLAGAYWRGDEKRPQLTRIYLAAFRKKEELEAHLHMLDEARKRDHRRLGKDLDLFSFHEDAGPGLAYWHPKGALMRMIIENYWREKHLDGGYEFVNTPHVGRAWLWETSGHLGFYKQNMYAPMKIDEDEYYVKPMNCPFHIMIYNSRLRSYRELPLRWAELGTVYRYEKGGVLHGLLRVRGFTQDDSHIFCTPEQIEGEILRVLQFSIEMLGTFGFSGIRAFLSTRPEDAVGEPARWEQAQAALQRAIEKVGLSYEVDEGGGAFYGPKIDLKIRDAIGREWQLTTIQFDFNMSERFAISYVGEDGQRHRPYMVHRALLGSLERFYGILIEHFAGLFPLWLAPVQIGILPVAEPHETYARKVMDLLKGNALRAEYMGPEQSLGKRIRGGEEQKIPYLLVIGDKEIEQNAVAVRNVATKKQVTVSVDEFVAATLEDVRGRKLKASIG